MALPELPEIPDILTFLRSADPDVLEAMGQQEVLEAFRSAAAEVSAYKDVLRKAGVDPAAVTDVEAFRSRVPLIDKSVIFPYRIAELCRNGKMDDISGMLPSSGHSGVFAFSVNTRKNVENTARMVDLALEYCLSIFQKRTILVNTYPMGVNVHTRLPVANTGVNADIALAIIKKFGPEFEQLVVVGQPLFAKHLIEEGLAQGVDWAGLNTNVVTGGEGFSESWRTYVSSLVGLKDPDRPAGRFVGSSMGIGELDLNLFHEIPDTIRIVRTAYRLPALRHALFGEGVETCPHFFMYYPMRTFIEQIPVAGSPVCDLAVSLVSPDIRNPLIRYLTGDRARILSYRDLERILATHAPGLPAPALHLPVVAVYGRKETVTVKTGAAIPAEVVKEAVFRQHEVAQAVTGFFKVVGVDGVLTVEVQLRRGVESTPHIKTLLDESLEDVLPARTPFRTQVHGFRDYPYETSYERKYPYIDKNLEKNRR
jgi:phenylacetate-coenzyme A ligase PaaK-like adenylate-forming protein